jgi:hypothetical protein
MGDRGNVKMIQPDRGAVFFYTRWHGSELKAIVKRALSRRRRWDDSAYLGRIIFSEMIHEAVLDETGYGIANTECHSGPLITVDCEQQRVTLGNKTWSFEKFVS